MNASSESGECASLISTGSFSVFEAVCWPDMGLSVPIPVRLRQGRVTLRTTFEAAASPWNWFLPERLSHSGRVYRRRTEETCASQGLAWRRAGRFLAKESLAYRRPANNWNGAHREANHEFRALQRRDHARDGVVERSSAVKVRLPEFLKQLEVVIRPPLVQAFAQGIGSVTAAGHTAILVASGRARSTKHRTYDFARSVENESLPEVARNSFVALVALANNGGLHGLGNTVRTFMEKNFEGCRALIA